MSALNEILDALRDFARDAQGVYTIVYNGMLPAQDSMCMALSAGGEQSTALDLRGDLNLDITCNAKHKDQVSVIDALADVHYTLPRMRNLPSGDGWQILSIATSSAPRFLERDTDQFLYGSAFEVVVFIE